jgi:hypothetical protein
LNKLLSQELVEQAAGIAAAAGNAWEDTKTHFANALGKSTVRNGAISYLGKSGAFLRRETVRLSFLTSPTAEFRVSRTGH